MATTISDDHQYLFLGKITQTLTAEEEQALRALFERDPRAREAYDALVRELPGDQVARSFDNLNAPGFWKNIPGELKDQQRLVRQGKLVRGAAALLLMAAVAAGGWWGIAHNGRGMRQDRGGSLENIARQAPGAVELRLADGSTVDLSTLKGSAQRGQLALDNSRGALSYSAMGADAAAGVNTVNVPVGMDYKVNLSDGSEIWLNSTSSLSFPGKFAGGKREITITGEAYCRIAARAGQPFVVHLPGNEVEVLGTEFNVNTYRPNVAKVALVDGAVNVVAGPTRTKLSPGVQAVVTDGKLTQGVFQAEKVLGWRQGIYVFEGADMAEISAVLARWFGVRTKLDDATLEGKRFTGALYKQKPLASFLDNLKVISQIDAYVDGDGVLHFKEGK